jgi:hypothetical protein
VRQKLDGIRNFFGIKKLTRISQKIGKLVKFTLGKKKLPNFSVYKMTKFVGEKKHLMGIWGCLKFLL